MTTDAAPITLRGWALVLGASSGFGAATSLALARAGLNIFGVHLDRKSTLPNAERAGGRDQGARAARRTSSTSTRPTRRSAPRSRARWSACSRERDEMGQVRVLLHSLAFGTLKLFVADPMKEAVTKAQMDMTLDVMAHSLVYWAQELVGRGLMGRGGRIYAMTSAGGARVLPYYGPVSAAKAALESNIRQLAAELAPARHHRQLHPRRRDRHARRAEDPQLRGVLPAGRAAQSAPPPDHHRRRGRARSSCCATPTRTGSPAT